MHVGLVDIQANPAGKLWERCAERRKHATRDLEEAKTKDVVTIAVGNRLAQIFAVAFTGVGTTGEFRRRAVILLEP